MAIMKSNSDSFTSASTLKEDSSSTCPDDCIQPVTEEEARRASASMIIRVRIMSPLASKTEDIQSETSVTANSLSQLGEPTYVMPQKSTTITTSQFHSSLMTPQTTPAKSPKRSYAQFGEDDASTLSAKRHQNVDAQLTPSTPTITLPTTRRRLWFHRPTYPTLYKNLDNFPSPGSSNQQSSQPSTSPQPLASSPVDLQRLQEELDEPLPSDVIPSSNTSSYDLRTTNNQLFTAGDIVDQDNSGNYHPDLAINEADDESVELGNVSDEEPEEINAERFYKSPYKTSNTNKPLGIRLSGIEYARFLESLLEQVGFSKVDEHVASNRGRKVFRRTLKEMFKERIEGV